MQRLVVLFGILSILSGCGRTFYDAAKVQVSPSDTNIMYQGRIDRSDSSAYKLFWPGSSIKLNFIGTEIVAYLQDSKGDNYYNIIIDDSTYILRPDTTYKAYVLATGLPLQDHTVEIFKRTEYEHGTTSFYGFLLPAFSEINAPDKTSGHCIEFIGNSITAGYGNEDFENDRPDSVFTNNYNSYAAITARHFNADYYCTAKGGIGIMISWFNYTMPQIYHRTNPLDSASNWDFNAQKHPDIVVVNLFQNDSWLVNKPERKEFKENFGTKAPNEEYIVKAYTDFISKIRGYYPKANIICALGSMDATKEGSSWPGYVSTAVDNLKKAGDEKIFTHFFAYKNSSGHPKVEEHQVMAKSLIEFIANQFNW